MYMKNSKYLDLNKYCNEYKFSMIPATSRKWLITPLLGAQK